VDAVIDDPIKEEKIVEFTFSEERLAVDAVSVVAVIAEPIKEEKRVEFTLSEDTLIVEAVIVEPSMVEKF